MIFPLFPLQVDITSFWKDEQQSSNDALFFGIFVAAIVLILVVLNVLRRNSPGSSSKGGGSYGFLSGLATHRIARNIGLGHDQIKMLDFVFKTDQVMDPEKSLNTPNLLDRHFRRAYREIEQSSGSEEEAQGRLSLLFSTRNILENSGTGTLTSTTQLRDDSTLVISNGRDKFTVPVVSSSGEQLTVQCPKNALGTSMKFQRGNKLTALAFTKSNKGFSFETRVLGYSTSFGMNTLLLAHSNQLKFLSHRRYRRKQTDISCFIFIVFVDGSGRKQRLVVDKRRLSGNIADISVGGCSIKTKAPIQVGSKLKIEFTQGDANVAALGQVLRTNRSGVVTVIHIKFLKVTRKSMNIINAFVYEYAYV